MVRECRTIAALTQHELAIAAGVSIGALRDLEQGRTRSPRWRVLSALADALGMDQYQRAELAAAWGGGHPDGGHLAMPTTNDVVPALRITVLGPLMAMRHGMPVGLGPARQRAVLGLLAIHWPAMVQRDVIVDMLWGAKPPGSAVTQVQVYVSRLRRLLDLERVPRGPDGPIVSAGGCYRLDESIRLDLAEFGQLARRADIAADQGERHLACALYERSLGLWRDDVLADIELLHGYPAAIEATRRRGEVVLRFARAAGTGGWRDRVLPHLRALCASEPFNELAHAQFMTVLAATGQQAAALELFGKLRRRLDIELGVRPGPQLAAAHLLVLRQQAGRP
jgi:DNA-binding SARP family transcriptional activator